MSVIIKDSCHTDSYLDLPETDPLDFMKARGSKFLDKTDFHNAGEYWVKGIDTRESGLENIIDHYNTMVKHNNFFIERPVSETHLHLTNKFFILETNFDSYDTISIVDSDTNKITRYYNIAFVRLFFYRRSNDFGYGSTSIDDLVFIKGNKAFWRETPICLDRITNSNCENVIYTDSLTIYNCQSRFEGMHDFEQIKYLILKLYNKHVLNLP